MPSSATRASSPRSSAKERGRPARPLPSAGPTTVGNAGYNRSYIGGWSYDGTTNRATLWRGVSTGIVPLDLNDQHFAYRGTSWWLETIEAINNSKAMVGTGWFNGKRRGYLLTPLTPGN